jgi:hypothetical protein
LYVFMLAGSVPAELKANCLCSPSLVTREQTLAPIATEIASSATAQSPGPTAA